MIIFTSFVFTLSIVSALFPLQAPIPNPIPQPRVTSRWLSQIRMSCLDTGPDRSHRYHLTTARLLTSISPSTQMSPVARTAHRLNPHRRGRVPNRPPRYAQPPATAQDGAESTTDSTPPSINTAITCNPCPWCKSNFVFSDRPKWCHQRRPDDAIAEQHQSPRSPTNHVVQEFPRCWFRRRGRRDHQLRRWF